ncbi:HNH endonuclease [Leifsonia naganoensis]|uniref:HNH nuclease domain-containing protein n=1 Tax=Leifsonia naganoensis TaxID=150025 RepID=A0A853DUN2_9MICO|nr:HNH endonuclease [Leifsonia naganoensis]NYK11987.1 hypothetical protein [Leifsonia naganoensis]
MATLEASEAEFLSLAPVARLHELVPGDPTLTEDDEKAIRYAYKKAASKRDGGEARALLNLIEASTDDRCALCLQTPVEELDHYLPKSPFARLAMTPSNLVPVCHRCNHDMQDEYSTNQEELPLHPYFDRIGGTSWVAADLTEEGEGSLQYRVERLADWDDLTDARVRNHFKSRSLASIWGSSASNLFIGHRGFFRSTYRLAGPDHLRATLVGLADSYDEAEYEPWRAVALRTWAASDWFCSGGWDIPV